MKVTETYKASDREHWHRWLSAHGETKKEVWLLFDDREDVPTVSYLDSVEEAICFGWIDGVQKRINSNEKAQRFTPRKPNGNWTELNKARARRLIKLGRMTKQGEQTLPKLYEPFEVPAYIQEEVNKDKELTKQFESLPPLYVRVRIGYIDEMRRKPEELAKRLNNFLSKTSSGKLFGNWNDGGRLDDDA